jgi:hypothetical protein
MRGREADFSELTEKEVGYLIGMILGDGYVFHDVKSRHYLVEIYLHSVKLKQEIWFANYWGKYPSNLTFTRTKDTIVSE